MTNKLIITDFEATCYNKQELSYSAYGAFIQLQEIIEIGCCVVVPNTLEIIHQFSILVRPVFYPNLGEFCRELTGITQFSVEQGVSFSVALDAWLGIVDFENDIFCSWGAWDEKILRRNCELFDRSYPFKRSHVNLKPLVANVLGNGRQCGILKQCRRLGLEFKGRHHRGLVDVLNIIEILRVMCKKVGKSLDIILEEEGIVI